jgi:Skp family chaperone for outer membrane proteins
MNKLLLICLLVLVPVSMASADLKIALVDLSKTFDSYYKTRDAQAKLKVKQDSYQKEVQDLITDYQHMGDDATALDKAASDPTLSTAARKDKSDALTVKKQDMVNLGQKIKETETEDKKELDEEIVRRHKELVDEITKVITDYSGPQGFDLVMDKSSATATGVSIILYNSSKLIDITEPIINLLNKSAPATGGAAAESGSAPTPATPAGH